MAYTAKGKRHLMKLCEMKCTFCSIEPCNNAHHIRISAPCGVGMKPPDWYAVPICNDCHATLHTKGELRFYNKNGWGLLSLIDYAKGLYNENA